MLFHTEMFSEHLDDGLWKIPQNISQKDYDLEDEDDFEEVKLRIRREFEEKAHRIIKREKR